jgi:hypothetical protein
MLWPWMASIITRMNNNKTPKIINEFLSQKRIHEYDDIYATGDNTKQQLAMRVEIMKILDDKQRFTMNMNFNLYQKFELVKPLMTSAKITYDHNYISQLEHSFLKQMELSAKSKKPDIEQSNPSERIPLRNIKPIVSDQNSYDPYIGNVISHPTLLELSKYIENKDLTNMELSEKIQRSPIVISNKEILLKVDLKADKEILRRTFELLINEFNIPDTENELRDIRRKSLEKLYKGYYLELADLMIFKKINALFGNLSNEELRAKEGDKGQSETSPKNIESTPFQKYTKNISKQLIEFLGNDFDVKWGCKKCLSSPEKTDEKTDEKNTKKNPYDSYRRTVVNNIPRWINDESNFIIEVM